MDRGIAKGDGGQLESKSTCSEANKLAVGAIDDGLEDKVAVRITEELEVASGVGGGAQGCGLTIRHNNTRGRVVLPKTAIGSTKHDHARFFILLLLLIIEHLMGYQLRLGLASEREVR